MAKNQQYALTGNTFADRVRNNALPMIKQSPDLLLASGVVMIIGLLIIPLPTFLMDMLIAINISFAILILLVAVYLLNPLEISAFPTILLIATLFRLGINVSTTRLILSEADAGAIIHAFGDFVIKGNYIVGIIIFLILLIINFVVIIKGSTRIAEVTARFTLDALPGKQMSIDADLNSGYIDEQEAKKRRERLTQESDFYGAMDGAAKFIKGDAIAGLVITGINIIGGFIIGMVQLDMSANEALTTYTMLTIGDGLVSQIPSLLISVAAGLVVTRSASESMLDVELVKQFGGKPRAVAVAGAAMIVMAFLPGFPSFPFLLLAGIAVTVAFFKFRQISQEKEDARKEEIAEAEEAQKEEQPVEDLLRVDPVEIELGYNLISLVDETQGGDVFKRITNVRRQLASELGIILPPVRVRDNLQLDPDEYLIKIRGNELARNSLHPNMLLAMNPGTAEGDIRGEQVTEPVFGLPATWITISERENAEILGYTVVEPATVLTTHLTELLRRNADKLLTRQDTSHLIENLKQDYPTLVDEITPESLPVATVQKVLQNLLKEGIPIRDLALILESLLEYYKVTKNVDVLTEYVRHNLSETIKKLYEDQNGVIHAIALGSNVEKAMSTALQTNNQASASPSLGLPPDIITQINDGMAEAVDSITLSGHMPLVICSAQVRPYFKRMISTQFPMVNVISYTEIPSDTDIEIHESVDVGVGVANQ